MAECSPLDRPVNLGSDQVTENFCEPCHDISGEVKDSAGFCLNCDESLCQECYDFHLRRKLFRSHQLVDKSTRPTSKSQNKHQDTPEKCQRHHGETLQTFCKSHSQVCCKVCLTINHQKCDTEDISKMARNIQTSGQLEGLNEKLRKMKTDFNENLSKAETNRSTLQSNYSQAKDEMKKLREEVEKLMIETENQIEKVKEEDLKQNQSVSRSCNVIIDQINKITVELNMLKDKSSNDNIFISMKRAENELYSFEESLQNLTRDNTVREYKFEPDLMLTNLMSQLKVLGRLTFLQATCTLSTKSAVRQQQMAKQPTYVKDINVSKCNLSDHGSVVLPNQQILITDYQNKSVKLIDTNKGTILSKIKLSGAPVNITTMETCEVAVMINNPNKIQILNLSKNILSTKTELSVNGQCYGIAYNDTDQNFAVAFHSPGKVEIINMTGSVVRTMDTDSNGYKLFDQPYNVVMSTDMSGMYVSNAGNEWVVLLSLNGDVKAVYKSNELVYTIGLCVHKSGTVYVVGHISHTVHQLDPDSGEFKLLLDQTDGLSYPYSISYCDVEDKMYVGMYDSPTLKVFEMK